jgi:periplasmic mercuric ion binding protein
MNKTISNNLIINMMKNKMSKFFVFLVLCTGMIMSLNASGQDKKTETVTIRTSAVCDMCKDRIEQGLAYEKGVKKAELDVKTKIVTITYNPAKTNPDELRKAISKLGYDADNVAADKTAYAKLPACCKKDAGKH